MGTNPSGQLVPQITANCVAAKEKNSPNRHTSFFLNYRDKVYFIFL